jgi:choline dehydrogenase-like flavoprotein
LLTDGRLIAGAPILEADICIVGAGVAGIALAMEFIGRAERVLVLEGGGLSFTKSLRELPTVARRHWVGEQGLARGVNAGHAYYPLRFTRARAFGGTSRAWHTDRGVHARPLDPIDFESRDGLPDHGWPFDRSHLDPFYRRAQERCALGAFIYEAAEWEASGYGSRLPLDEDRVRSEMFLFGKDSKFDRFEPDLVNAENVTLVLHANAVHLADSGGRVDRIDCATLSGNRFVVQAGTFVLAAGALENARLLLVSRDDHPNGIGNDQDLVGRYFMEHPDAAVGFLVPDPKLDREAFRLYRHQHVSQNVMIEAMFRISDPTLRDEHLLNAVLRLRPTYRSAMAPAVRSGQIVRRSIHHGVLTPRLIGHVGRTVLGSGQVIRHFANKSSQRPPDVFGIDVMAEQAPTWSSRMRLSPRSDRLGVPLTVLEWQPTGADFESIRRTVEIFADTARKAGIGEVISILERDHPPPAVFGNWHQLGTTRMHHDPGHGVVDEHCRVHGMSNLYLAGGSIFPTGGYANPSLTITALSIRLADYLRSQPETSSFRSDDSTKVTVPHAAG